MNHNHGEECECGCSRNTQDNRDCGSTQGRWKLANRNTHPTTNFTAYVGGHFTPTESLPLLPEILQADITQVGAAEQYIDPRHLTLGDSHLKASYSGAADSGCLPGNEQSRRYGSPAGAFCLPQQHTRSFSTHLTAVGRPVEASFLQADNIWVPGPQVPDLSGLQGPTTMPMIPIEGTPSPHASSSVLTYETLQHVPKNPPQNPYGVSISELVTRTAPPSRTSSRVCKECHSSFDDAKSLQRHNIKEHEPKRPCPWCQKLLKPRDDNTRRHLRVCKQNPISEAPASEVVHRSPRIQTGAYSGYQAQLNNTSEQPADTYQGQFLQQRHVVCRSQVQSGSDHDQRSRQTEQYSTNVQVPDPTRTVMFSELTLPINSSYGRGLVRQGQFSPPGNQHNMAPSNPSAPNTDAAYAAEMQNDQRFFQQSFHKMSLGRPTIQFLDQSYETYIPQPPLDMRYDSSQRYDLVGNMSQTDSSGWLWDDNGLCGAPAPQGGSNYGRPSAGGSSGSIPAQSRYRNVQTSASGDVDEAEDATRSHQFHPYGR